MYRMSASLTFWLWTPFLPLLWLLWFWTIYILAYQERGIVALLQYSLHTYGDCVESKSQVRRPTGRKVGFTYTGINVSVNISRRKAHDEDSCSQQPLRPGRLVCKLQLLVVLPANYNYKDATL